MAEMEGEGGVALSVLEACDVDASFEHLPCMALIERGGVDRGAERAVSAADDGICGGQWV